MSKAREQNADPCCRVARPFELSASFVDNWRPLEATTIDGVAGMIGVQRRLHEPQIASQKMNEIESANRTAQERMLLFQKRIGTETQSSIVGINASVGPTTIHE